MEKIASIEIEGNDLKITMKQSKKEDSKFLTFFQKIMDAHAYISMEFNKDSREFKLCDIVGFLDNVDETKEKNQIYKINGV